RAHFLPPLLLL
uniref:U1-poneritoxin-Dq2c n=1 Tax=Dinoponera quadriceps TaxID=609295 RepID=TX2AC_DINQU|nr:RecName: Full=U1-poneritoxin-Dq2c; Short=U1-PONTX-Dq2c; AltName: Full=Peptide Dq-1289; AltName: Full=Poneratoxin; Contains: RecName: Full=U1-poneritoxin-Dq2a; Short=U1-PONTX-Dq2a; AltName: Full=Peptide Dq-1061 [Dinoponera quadriceps]